jgi:bla regulator protein BlaR1
LVPLGLLNGLGVDEVEAIISHELAHLKRKDYMVNLFQSFVEIVFFFNPGVLWISKLIKEERENCCDDLALSCTESKYQYIKALISCQEFSANYQNYAMAITGRKNTLKDRVSRMVFDSNSSLNRIEKTILSIGLVSLLIFSTAFTKVRTYVKENRILTAKEVTVFFGQAPLDTTKRQVVKKFPQKVRSNVDKPKNAAEVKARQNDVKRYQADMKRQQNNIIEYQANMLKYQDDMKKYQTDLARCVADPINNKLPVAPTVPVIAQTPSAPTAPSVHKTTTVRAVKNANTSVSVYTPINVSPNISVNLGHIQPLVAEKKVSMTDELRIQGLLKDLNNFEYKLNAEEFVINGVKQSEDIHRKYMKYLKNKKGTITTTVSTD